MAEEASLREAYGHTLVELGRTEPRIVVLDADLCKSTMTQYFLREFPSRSFDVGIAEQNMIGIAAGLAASGKTPFASTFAVFAPGRCFDQIRISVAQPHLNVKIVTTHGGITVGEDGISHQSVEDLSLICSLPGFTVIVPADAVETAQAIRAAADTYGPFYVRLCRGKTPVVFGDDYRFCIGKAATVKEGKDAAIIAMGIMLSPAIEAADILRREGITCRVINMSTLKPIDEQSIVRAAVETGAIVTAEEHLEHGGLGSEVARIIARTQPVPMEFVSMRDTYAQSGKADELLVRYGLTAKDVAAAVRTAVKRK